MLTSPIPLFPLGLVLMPGAVAQLHIFEPRYRAMISHVAAGTRCFGLIAPPPNTPEAELPAGRVGCIACITEVEALPDGRSNIVVEGRERFRFETYLDVGTPYRLGHIAAVNDVHDARGPLTNATAQVRTLATRAIRASLALQGLPGDVPQFDDDATTLSFQIAQLLAIGPTTQYELLADLSALSRLERLASILRGGLEELERAAERRALEQPDDDGPVTG